MRVPPCAPTGSRSSAEVVSASASSRVASVSAIDNPFTRSSTAAWPSSYFPLPGSASWRRNGRSSSVPSVHVSRVVCAASAASAADDAAYAHARGSVASRSNSTCCTARSPRVIGAGGAQGLRGRERRRGIGAREHVVDLLGVDHEGDVGAGALVGHGSEPERASPVPRLPRVVPRTLRGRQALRVGCGTERGGGLGELDGGAIELLVRGGDDPRGEVLQDLGPVRGRVRVAAAARRDPGGDGDDDQRVDNESSPSTEVHPDSRTHSDSK